MTEDATNEPSTAIQQAGFLHAVLGDYRREPPFNRGFDESHNYENLTPYIRQLIELGFLAWRKGLPADETYNAAYRIQATPKLLAIRDKFV